MRLTIALSKDTDAFIAVSTPLVQDLLGQIAKFFAVFTRQTDRRHRPFHPASLDIRIPGKRIALLDWCLCHGKGIAAPLIMIMRQDGTADNRQIRIRAQKVMREDRDEVQQIFKALAGYLHRDMLAVQYDAVLIVIRVRRVLHEPPVTGQAQWNQTMRLAGRMTGMTSIAFILTAQQTFRIRAGFHELCLGNIPRILLRLGQIDGDIEIAIFRSRLPDDILIDTILADVVRSNAHLVEFIRSRFRGTGIVTAPPADNLRRTWHDTVHDTRVKKVALIDRILDQPLRCRIVEHILKDWFSCF